MLIAMKNNVPGGSINEQPIEQAQCTTFNSHKTECFPSSDQNLSPNSPEMAILLLYTGTYKRAENMYFI